MLGRSLRVRSTALATLTLLSIAVSGTPSRAQGVAHDRFRGPLVVRIEGYAGRAPKNEPTEAHWSLARGRSTYPFAVSRLFVLTGSASRGEILSLARVREPTFYLAGDSTALGRFFQAGPGRRIVMIAQLRLGGRYLVLGRVDLVEQPPEQVPGQRSP